MLGLASSILGQLKGYFDVALGAEIVDLARPGLRSGIVDQLTSLRQRSGRDCLSHSGRHNGGVVETTGRGP